MHLARPQLSHFGIFVQDLELMSRFYTDFLGFIVTDHGHLGDRQLTFLSSNPDEHHELVLCSGRTPRSTSTVNQISFRLSDLRELRSMHAAAIAWPAIEVIPIDHGTAWSVYCRDPEGNRIELYVHTPWYVPQPLREPLELSQDDVIVQARTEARCRALPGFTTRSEWQAHFRRQMAARLQHPSPPVTERGMA